VVAVRFGGCCDQVLPVPAASLGSDPCVVAYRPGVEVPAACELRRPEICPAMMCPPLKPLTLLAEAKLDGSCTWKSECAADGDCVVAEDCRAPKECCSCGTILPRVVAEADACVIYGKKSYPQPGCGQRCPDFCGEGTPPPTPIGSCRELDSVGWPGLRRCEPAVDPGAYLLMQAPAGYAGLGPAVEVQGSGRLRAWKSAPSLQPHPSLIPEPDLDVTLSPGQLRGIFDALDAVSWSGLPHKGGSGWECYPTLHYERVAGQATIELQYTAAHELLPELQTVYTLLGAILKPKQIAAPADYCELEL